MVPNGHIFQLPCSNCSLFKINKSDVAESRLGSIKEGVICEDGPVSWVLLALSHWSTQRAGSPSPQTQESTVSPACWTEVLRLDFNRCESPRIASFSLGQLCWVWISKCARGFVISPPESCLWAVKGPATGKQQQGGGFLVCLILPLTCNPQYHERIINWSSFL